MPRCPGLDPSRFKPDDVFELICPSCGNSVEFWKDESKRKCKKCGQDVRNPRLDLGCAKWCKFAAQCLGKEVDDIES